MKIGIVEHGGGLTEEFQKIISEKIAGVQFVRKKALDLFDVLALARQIGDGCDQLVIIVFMGDEEKEQRPAFYMGLATLEAETGKIIFKHIYEDESDIKEFAELFINYLYYPAKLEKEEEKEESEDDLFSPV
jgi:riboflavin synthase